jgi:hypothetical protein
LAKEPCPEASVWTGRSQGEGHLLAPWAQV